MSGFASCEQLKEFMRELKGYWYYTEQLGTSFEPSRLTVEEAQALSLSYDLHYTIPRHSEIRSAFFIVFPSSALSGRDMLSLATYKWDNESLSSGLGSPWSSEPTRESRKEILNMNPVNLVSENYLRSKHEVLV